MTIYKKFTKDVLLVGAVNMLGFLRGIIILPVITKTLGVVDYGIWSQLRTTMTLLAPIIVLGLPSALIRFLSVKKDSEAMKEGMYSVLAFIFMIALAVAALLYIFSGEIAAFFQCETILVKILGFIILLECVNSIFLAFFRVLQQMDKYAFFMILQLAGEVMLTMGAVFWGFGLLGAVMALLIIRVVIFLFLFATIVRKIGIKIPTFSPLKKYVSFSLPTLISSLSYWAVTSSDRYLVNFFLGILFVGYYAPGYSIANIINMLIYPLGFVLSFSLPKLFDENKMAEVKTFFKYSLKYYLLAAIPAVFGLSLLSRQFLIIFSTEEIAANGYFVLPFVACSILLYGVSHFFTQILLLVKKTKITGYIWLSTAVLNLLLNIIFIPAYGIFGAALTTLVAYAFALALTWYFAFKEFQFEIDWLFISKSILSSASMVLFIIYFNPIGLLKTSTAVILSIFIYGVLIFLVKGIHKKEIYFLKNLMKQ